MFERENVRVEIAELCCFSKRPEFARFVNSRTILRNRFELPFEISV